MLMSERGKRILSFIIAVAFILTGFVYSPKSAAAAAEPQVSVLGASLKLDGDYNANGNQSMRIAITVDNASMAKSCSIDLTVGNKTVTIATDGVASATRVIHDKMYLKDPENDSVVYAVILSNIPQNCFSIDIGIKGHAELIASPETKSSESITRTVDGIVSEIKRDFPGLNISLINGVLYKNNGTDKLTLEDIRNYTGPTADPNNAIWVATWGTAEEKCDTTDTAMPHMALEGTTVRQIIRVTTTGNKMKLKLSNQYGQSAVEVQSLHVAKQVKADESTIDTSTDTVVKVNGSESFSIPAGKTIETDPVDFPVNALENVAISMYFGKTPTNNITGHRGARATTYQMSGNNVSAQTFSSYETTTSWFFLADVSLMQPENAKAVVCFGDSITDGYGTDAGYLGKKPDSYTRWGDYFAKRLQANASTKNISVINEGIGANSMMGSYPTDAGKDRFRRDLLEHDGVGYCIVLFGVNDLNKLGDTSKYNQLKPEYEKMVALAHANGIKIYAAPILPFGTSDYYSDASEQVRTMLNNWMRSEESGFDGIIDFESALADPANPKNIKYEYTLGDGLHPYEGYDVMANAIDLTMFDGTYVRPTAAPATPVPTIEPTRDPATNLATNGDFSNGNTGWTSNYGGYTPTVVDGYGVYSGRWNSFSAATYTINRRFAAGDVVEFTFDVKLEENYEENSDTSFSYWFEFSDGTEGTKYSCYDTKGNVVYGNAEIWTRVQGSYTVPAYTDNLTIYIGEGTGQWPTDRNGIFYIDNLHIGTKNAEPPVPTAVPTAIPPRDPVTMTFDPSSIVIVGAPEGEKATLDTDGSISYEQESGFSGMMIPLPAEYVIGTGQSFYIHINYESEGTGRDARVYLLNSANDSGENKRSDQLGPGASPLEGEMTATGDGAKYIFVKASAWDTTFTSLKIKSITLADDANAIPTPTREPATVALNSSDVIVVGGSDGANVTVNAAGSISYERAEGFTGFIIPIPSQYVLNNGESFDIIMDYESAENNARIYLLSGTADNAQSNIIAAGPSPLVGTLTAKTDNVNYIYVKSHTYGAKFTSLKINSITIKESIKKPEGSLNLSNAELNNLNGASYDMATGKLIIDAVDDGTSLVFIPLNGEIPTNTTATVTIKGSYTGTNGFRVWLGNGHNSLVNDVKVFNHSDLPSGEFEESFNLVTKDVCSMLTFKSIGSAKINGLTIENIIVKY